MTLAPDGIDVGPTLDRRAAITDGIGKPPWTRTG